MEACKSMARIKPEKLGCMAVLACVLVVPIIILALPNITSQSLDIMSLQLPIREAHVPLSTVNEAKDSYKPPDAEISIQTLEAEEIEDERKIDADINTVVFTDAANEIKLQQNYTRKDATNPAVLADASNEKKQLQNYTRNDTKMTDLVLDSNEKKQEANNTRKGGVNFELLSPYDSDSYKQQVLVEHFMKIITPHGQSFIQTRGKIM